MERDVDQELSQVEQIAALPLQWQRGKLRVLMVTSRDTHRWIMPKGWPMNGKKPWRAAEIEALEEAGAVGAILHDPLGTYQYRKRLPGDGSVLCTVTIYPMMVEQLRRRWKEAGQRKRRWFSLKKAAKLVEEQGLAKILRDIDRRAETKPALKKYFKAH